ncbi:hypothetical protein N7E02_03875 (plasmid) [Aliirhizobium terrae]|uniref:hypothetical protein n=1 Tax=Terrirhizobium terrae TaxID=2926709 RepID=UPI002578CF1A|nr:hypothetical protein [Rhizobium sp. CC-CFT758]WJH38555.1 hypothetical protein N7E02_03875 [Rhizobium sp. CC-CFT758]
MLRLCKPLPIALILVVSNAAAGLAQDAVTPSQIESRDPNACGAAGAGCDPAAVQEWKVVGNRLADLSSADLSQYAYACAQHQDWKKDCETDPAAVLRRLGIEGY